MRRTVLALAISLAFAGAAAVRAESPATSSATAAAASASIYVFADSKPLSGAVVRAGGTLVGTSDARGGAAFGLAPGVHAIAIERDGAVALAFELEVAPREEVQVAASLFGHRAPVYQVRSSVHGERTVDTAPPPAAAAPAVAAPAAAPISPDGAAVPPPADADAAPESSQLDAVTVEGTVRTDDQAAYVEERRASTNVTEVLSAEQIDRSGDSDAAAALRRVTGLTLVDDRHVYVRGLGERYSSVLLNGAQIPSPDPTRRVVPLDLFPTGVLEGMVVQKSYSADLPGEFGGGTVSMRTKRFPESFHLELSGTLGYTDGATFEDALDHDGGGRDWTGRDDGTRELPAALAAELADGRFLREASPLVPEGATAQEIEAYGEALAGVFDVERRELGPNTGFAGAIGNSWRFGEDVRAGVLASVRHTQDHDRRDETRRTFVASDAGLELDDFADIERTIRAIDGSVFVTSGLELGSNHFLRHTSMLVRQTEDETRVATGLDDHQQTRITELEWIENSLLAHQVGGEHWFPAAHDLSLAWQYTRSRAEREAPNRRRYRYDLVEDGDGGARYEFSQRSDNLAIVFEQLADDSDTLDLKLGLPLALSDSVTLQLAAGASRLERDRDSSIRRFGFQSPQPGGGVPPEVFANPSLEAILDDLNIGPQGFRLFESTRATDNYVATQSLSASFASAEFAVADRFRGTLGLRRERNEQAVTTFAIGSASAVPVVSRSDEDELLPALNLTWFATPDAQLRASYAETLSRPDFRELSPAPYIDPEQDAETLGNPDLVSTGIRNYDLRYEHYFSPGESVSAGVFLKDFENPIELVRIPGSGVLLTLANAREARNYGFELEYFASLGLLEAGGWGERLGIADWLDWDNWYLGLNYAYIESEVELDEAAARTQTNARRALQGQSPYVTNLQLGWLAPDGEREVTLSYNRFGARIAQVGIAGAPDIFERPASQLDLVWQEALGRDWRIKLRARNLLDPRIEFTQGPETTREFRRGRELHVTLEWSPSL